MAAIVGVNEAAFVVGKARVNRLTDADAVSHLLGSDPGLHGEGEAKRWVDVMILIPDQ